MANFIPKYIRQVVADQSGHRVKATDWNALWNLLITASDHNSETLNSLINLGDIVVNSTAHDALVARVDNLEGAGFISTELDPSVPAWAKNPIKPVYTAAEVGALANTSTLATIAGTSTHRTVSDAEKATWNAKQAALVSGTDYLTPTAIGGLYQPKKAATDLYVTAAEKTTWNAKQNPLVVGTDYLTAATIASLYEVKRNAEQHYLTTAQQTALHAHSNKPALDLVSGTNTGDQDLSGLAALNHNHNTLYAPVLGTNDNYVTDVEKAALHGHANKGALDLVTGTNTGDQDLSGKQDLLVSGTNIKTINELSILGTGNITITGGEGSGVAFGDLIATYTTGSFATLDFSVPGNYKVHGGTGYVSGMPSGDTVDTWYVVTVLSYSDSAPKSAIIVTKPQFSSETYINMMWSSNGVTESWSGWKLLVDSSVLRGGCVTWSDFNSVRVQYDSVRYAITAPYTNKPADMTQSSGEVVIQVDGQVYSNFVQSVFGTQGEDAGKLWVRGFTAATETWSAWNLITGAPDLSSKQDVLVSGTNIKTINGVNVLGSGNIVIEGGTGGGVTSVNTQTGAVVLNADHIDDASTIHKFVTSADVTKLSNLSGTNTGDQDLSGLASLTHNHTGVYAPVLGTDDNYVTDAEKTALHAHNNKGALDLVSGTNTGDETTASIKAALGITTLSGSNTGDQDLSGYALTGHDHTGVYASALGADDNYVTAAEKTLLANTSGVNTGDQDLEGLAKALTDFNGYPGFTLNDYTTSNWIRTTSSGLIPYAVGGASSSLGTSGWAFANIYGTAIYQGGVRVPRVQWGTAVANPVAGDMYFTA